MVRSIGQPYSATIWANGKHFGISIVTGQQFRAHRAVFLGRTLKSFPGSQKSGRQNRPLSGPTGLWVGGKHPSAKVSMPISGFSSVQNCTGVNGTGKTQKNLSEGNWRLVLAL
jgi:hypothetical protein